MPYLVRQEGPRRFTIVRKDTGKAVGHSSSREKAEASVRARLAGEHGWRPKK